MAVNSLGLPHVKIVVSGGSGFLGEALVSHLLSRGQVFVLTRSARGVERGTPLEWDPPHPGSWEDTVASADVVINLAGASIADGRWTEKRRGELVESRLGATRALVKALQREPARQRTFLSASAVGIYQSSDAVLDEGAPQDDGFLGDLARRWEAAAREAESCARVVILRFAMILHPAGGALGRMLPPFRLGAGGRLGNGSQWMPWVSRDDAVRVVEWAIDTSAVSGVYNVSAPQPVTNAQFTAALGAALRRPAIMHVPRFALRAAFGEMADPVLLSSQRVVPARLLDEGFEFRHAELRPALEEMLR